MAIAAQTLPRYTTIWTIKSPELFAEFAALLK